MAVPLAGTFTVPVAATAPWIDQRYGTAVAAALDRLRTWALQVTDDPAAGHPSTAGFALPQT
ncbi:hypothetical protein WME75_21965 [Sorangium sp. So ce1014]|uniref:hypothetical protein n=1 Tax=Sorangium sp. So ce1014 TaxID=3133326 RepID=UPI003F619812